jgi:hypothetical protein
VVVMANILSFVVMVVLVHLGFAVPQAGTRQMRRRTWHSKTHIGNRELTRHV